MWPGSLTASKSEEGRTDGRTEGLPRHRPRGKGAHIRFLATWQVQSSDPGSKSLGRIVLVRAAILSFLPAPCSLARGRGGGSRSPPRRHNPSSWEPPWGQKGRKCMKASMNEYTGDAAERPTVPTVPTPSLRRSKGWQVPRDAASSVHSTLPPAPAHGERWCVSMCLALGLPSSDWIGSFPSCFQSY